MKNERLWYVFVIVCLVACVGFLPTVFYSDRISLVDLIDQLSFSSVTGIRPDVIPLFFGLFPYLLFQILWGISIYSHFCVAGVYYFTRKVNKLSWYFKECLKLYLWGVLLLVGLGAAGFLTMLLSRKGALVSGEFRVLLFYIVIYSLFLFATTLLVNILSICFQSMVGFGVLAGFELLWIAAIGVWDGWMVDLRSLREMEVPGQAERMKLFVLKCNPISHLILNWHSSSDPSVDAIINRWGMDFDLWYSVLYWLIFSVIILLAGAVTVKRVEFLNNERE